MKTYQIDNDVVQDFEEIKPVANELLDIVNTVEWSVGYNNLLLLQKIKEIKSGVFVQCGVFKGWTLVPALLYCKKYNYDILTSIHAAKTDNLIADDNKPIMKESRFITFKKKYDKYKAIYEQNVKYENFANWYFEKKLLGYSYSHKLKEVFKNERNSLKDSLYYRSMENNDKAKFIGVVEDSFKSTSANGNKYIKILLSDELGNIPAIMVDSRRQATCSEYLESNKAPDKDNIVVLTGRKGDDILFIDGLSIVDEKICMKLADLK